MLLRFIVIVMYQVRIFWIHIFLILNLLFLEPKYCGTIFRHDDDKNGSRYREGWAYIYDGAKLGIDHSLDESPIFVYNDDLSSIQTNAGNDFKSK